MTALCAYSVTAFDADGTVTLGTMSGIAFNQPWSIELWACFETLPDSMTLISRATEFSLTTNGAALTATVVNGGTFMTGDILETGVWYWIALTYDGTLMSMYVDGLFQGYVSVQNGNPVSGNAMTIGGGFVGQLEVARFWNTDQAIDTLIPNQFQPWAPGTPNLVAQIDFTHPTPDDTSGNSTPVTVVSPSPTDVESVVLTPAAEQLQLGFCAPFFDTTVNPGGQATQSDFSVMAWVAPTYLDGTQVIFSNGVMGATGMSLALNTDGNVVFQVGTATPIISTSQVAPNSWTNVACTWSASTGSATLFVKGVQDTTGTMTNTTTVAAAPLIGAAIGSNGIPSSNFIGCLQSVDVFNAALSAATITTFLTSNPAGTSNCVASYNLTSAVPQNSVTTVSIGLFGATTINPTSTAPSDLLDNLARTTPRPRDREGVILPNLRPEHYAPERREAMVAEFRELLTARLRMPPEEQEAYAARMAAALARVERELAAGTHRAAHYFTVEEQADGTATLTLHTAEGSAVVLAALSPCQAWGIGIVIDIVLALFTVFGFAISASSASSRLGAFLAQRINMVQSKLSAIFSSGAPTASTTFAALSELNRLGLLEPLVLMTFDIIRESVSWWAIAQVVARILLLCSPWAGAALAGFLIDLVAAIGTLVSDWAQQPSNCWTTSVVPTAA